MFEYLHGPKEQKYSFKNPGVGSMHCESHQCRVEFIFGVRNAPACVFFSARHNAGVPAGRGEHHSPCFVSIPICEESAC